MFKSVKRKTTIRYKKFFSFFILFTILNQLFAPGIAYALTSGPTAPEATSFEPIDTTDMVNPLTGDLTYSLPLLEVPGPEGSYPLALSYHAGIQPNEEASWVGLGWSLNPGAITRNVNGYPDDWDNVTNVTRSYWSGGSTKTVGVDVGVGLGPASVSFGLSFSQDTYRGFGVGESLGVGVNISGSPFQAGVSIGESAYGDVYYGANIGVAAGIKGNSGLALSGGIGISSGFGKTSIGAGAGVTALGQSLLGTSISSSGGAASFTMGGAALSVNNANQGKITTESSGFKFAIPIPGISIGVSYNYTRYYSDETASVATNGTLYSHSFLSSISDLNNSADDTYFLLDAKNANIVQYPDPEKLVGGTFPDFDDYSVTAQGLSGNIRPYIFKSVLYSQNRINNSDHSDDVINQYPFNSVGALHLKPQFRFINDFSNSYRQSSSLFADDNYYFDDAQYGNNDGDFGFDQSTDRLEGSKHIEWFTNQQIIGGAAQTKGFVDCQAAGFIRPANDQIGGFMITNASGVTYHYALPAYSSQEFIHTEKIDQSQGYTYNDLHKTNPYAYTWYLTAITGPDYVDRGTIGQLDNADWGYWVKFDYGLWTHNFDWRNPSEGFHKDLDNEFQNYSSGTKDVYYLDAIETRSHTALFVKELRADAKSLGSNGFEYFSSAPGASPRASLKLNSIVLLQNDQFTSSINSIRAASTNYNWYNGRPVRTDGDPIYLHYGVNMIDINDINQLSENLAQKCLRRIQLNYDYSSCPGTPNSYDEAGQMYSSSTPTPPANSAKLGKMTLLSVDFQGKGGVSTLPLTEFQYDLDPTQTVNQDNISITQISGDGTGTISESVAGKFSVGDIISFSISGVKYYCTLLAAYNTSYFNIRFLNQTPSSIASGIAAVKTKNPPYNKDAYDIWGCYKSDYISGGNENLSRITSSVSNKATDVWSLRKIKSALGSEININYEGDTYSTSVLNKIASLTVNGAFCSSCSSNLHLVVHNPNNLDLTQYFKVGQAIKGVLLFNNSRPSGYSYTAIDPNSFSTKSIITSISGTDIYLQADNQMLSTALQHAQPAQNIGDVITYPGRIDAGNIQIANNSLNYGGGLRVRDVIVDDLNGGKQKTSYNYLSPNTASMSSGVTSYEPGIFDYDEFDSIPFNNSTDKQNERRNYRSVLYKDLNYLLGIAREVPSPGVMYEYVTVADSTILSNGNRIPIAGTTMYQYEVYKANMLDIDQYQHTVVPVNGNESINGNSIYIDYKARMNMAIKDYTSRLGNLKRVVTYDVSGNKLTEKINHYLHDPLDNSSFLDQVNNYESMLTAYNNIGVIKERYGNARIILDAGTSNNYASNYYTDAMVMSSKETFPAILTGTTQIDYKNSTKTEQQNLAFDFYSGSVTKTQNSDSYGNKFITEVTPAYRVYPSMGLKTHDVLNKQMLTQQASTYTYSVDGYNQKLGVIKADVQTWGNDIPTIDQDGNGTTIGQSLIWRMKANYSWMPLGSAANNITSMSSFVDYFNSANSNAAWKKTGEITLYNVYSSALEATDINTQYAATRMGYNNSKVVISGGPAKYNELAYAGVEDPLLTNGNFSNNISPGSGTINTDTIYTHTGYKSLKVAAGQQGFTYTLPVSNVTPRDYSVAVWVKPAAVNSSQAALYYQVGGGSIVSPSQTLAKSAAGWYLLEMKIPSSVITSGSGNLIIGCKNNGSAGDLYFDDFRFQPSTASASAYVYDNYTSELTYILNNNNLFTRFQYDAAGRLVRTYKEVLGKAVIPMIHATNYNYGKGH